MKSEGVKKHYWQCTECGQVNSKEIDYNIDSDDIYDILYCKHCHADTKQLWCGNDILDFYELYDCTMDSHFITDNTKLFYIKKGDR